MTTTKESECEDLIADFLEEKDIDFERQVKISNLKNDIKSYREADFYLPKYKVYIEFLGMWDNPNPEHKIRYKKKMSVYRDNKIPCIYLWPNNLGTLDWIIRRRLRETLITHNKRAILAKYEISNYLKENAIIIGIMGVLIIYSEMNFWPTIIITTILISHLYSTIKTYIDRLKKINNCIKLKNSQRI